MYLFFEENIDETIKSFHLSPEESRHCCKVMRLQKGSIINVINGKGDFFECEIVEANTKKTSLWVLKHEQRRSQKKYLIHVAIAPTKNIDRIEWFIEKAVEIGIDQVSFILAQNSERKIIKLERLKKIALSAMKQSYSFEMPDISEMIDFKEFVKSERRLTSQKFLAHEVQNPDDSLFKSALKEKAYCILIGPEGGFNEEEVSFAKENGFEIVSLGNKRLRTETAGLMSCAILNLINQN